MNFEEFSKVELKTARVLEAERVEGSSKLVKLKVSLGQAEGAEAPEIRQILAGIGKAYEPEQLIGKQIIIVANLELRSLMGFESQGMLLAASGENGPRVLVVDGEVADGSEIK